VSKFTTEVHLSREMKLLDVTMIGVGAMIGAGIFVLTGIAAGVAGPALIVAFALNGFVALLTAMSYAELGSCYHDAGGGYLWVKEGLPRWNGFLSGWMSWFAHAVACSLYALGFGAYVEHVLSNFGVHLPQILFLTPQKLLAAAVALAFAYLNFRGASETGKVGNLVTLAKIAILGVFVAFGLHVMFGKEEWTGAFTPFFPSGWAGVFKAMGLTFIAFQGFEVISQCSEEVKNPKRNIPRAVFLSLLIVVPIYLLVAVTSLGSVSVEPGIRPWDFLAMKKETALVDVAEMFFAGGGVMLLIGGIISTMSALNATVYSSSRVAFAMGRDRNFPGFFARIHAGRFTPHVAIALSIVIVVAMSISLPIEDVASAADIMFLLLFLQVNLTLIRLRKLRPDLDRGFFTPLFPFLTIAGILLLLFLAVYMVTYSPLGWFVTAGWIGVGLVVYRTYASGREIEHARTVRALERLERKEFTILVPLSNPQTAGSLLEIATAIARQHTAEMVLLHVIEVDQHKPLRAGYAEGNRVEPFLEEAREAVEKSGLPVRTLVEISHQVSQGILGAAMDEQANFVILGRRKQQSFGDRVFATIIDTVLDRAPCEVAVLHGTLPAGGVKKVLIPFGQNIHTRLALEIAPAIVEYFKAEAEVIIVNEPDSTAAGNAARQKQIGSLLREHGLSARLKFVRSRGILQGVIRQSRNADLIVMGGRSGDLMGLLFGQSLTQEITNQAACSVLWVSEYEPRESFWTRFFKPTGKEGTESHEQSAAERTR
jgi:amino acid transporter/nucleotide-binding universal stress UspA family protein